MRRSSARLEVGALALVMVAALAACGSNDEPPTTSSDTPNTSEAPAFDNDLAVTFTGGTAGQKADESLSPINVGTINMEGGTVADPEAAIAMRAAFDYVNDQLGGIGGHPVKLVACGAANTEEDVQRCAQQMLNDSSVSVVVEGGLNFGTGVVHSVLGGAKPVIEAESNPGEDTTAAWAYSTNANAVATIPGFAAYVKQLGAKTVAMAGGDGVGDQAIEAAMKEGIEAVGATVKLVNFPATGTDLLAPYTAAGAADADLTVPAVVQAAQCIASAKALEQLNIAPEKILGISLCASTAVKEQLGTWPKWSYVSPHLSLDAPDSTGQVALYKAVMAQYAPADAEIGINAPFSFGAAFAAVNVLNTVGADNVTPEAVNDALKAFTGPVLLGPPTLAFGSIPDMPAIGALTTRVYTFDGTSWTATTDWQS